MPPVFLIPGVGEDEGLWADVRAEGLPAAVCGDPRHGTAIDCVDLLASYVDALLLQLPESPAVVVGHSLGGILALELARRVPVRGIVLVACGIPMTVSPRLSSLAQADPPGALALIASAATGGRRGGVGPGGGEIIAARLLEQMTAAHPARISRELEAAGRWDPGQGLAELSSAPVIVLAGEHDGMVPVAASARLAQALGAKLRVQQGCGHQLPWQAPHAIVEAVDALMS